jgi:hypothetical protein
MVFTQRRKGRQRKERQRKEAKNKEAAIGSSKHLGKLCVKLFAPLRENLYRSF